MGIISSGLTHIGQVRKNNQDSIYFNDEHHLYIVADGMGGHSGGEIASSIAVETIPKFILANSDNKNPIDLLRSALKYANQAIFQQAKKDPALKGMGTTVVLIYFSQSNLYVANVGDSRSYLINRGSIYQLSRDHSLIQEKLNLGIYTREDALKDRMKNVLVRAVGHEEKVEVDIFTYRVARNDIFFICSDGLHGKVSDKDLLSIVYRNIPNPESANQNTLDKTTSDLIAQANQNGGQDNISVILSVAQ